MVLLCFVLAAGAFLGSTFYADTRFAEVVRLTHDVSDNAMPSLAEIGVMQRALADIQYSLDEQAEGREMDSSALHRDLRELQEARHKYESYPKFAGEQELWSPARPALDALPSVVTAIHSAARAGALAMAQRRLDEEFAPTEATLSKALAGVDHVNLEMGTLAARQADSAWSRTRVVAFALDFACALLTAGLALLALRSARRLYASEAQRADELDAFAARVAHDIRGPLTPPLFALDRLVHELDADSPHRVLVERGLRGLLRAESLVGDLLTFARADAAPEGQASASLRAVVEGAVQDLERDASRARVRIDVGDLPPATVCCSPGVLSSIVGNLVSNAIKHMPSDATSRVVSIRAQANGERVRVEVADTGAGVSERHQKRIFEPYVRGPSARPGLGLGLATVKRLVVAHGGSVGLSSRAGNGAAFWFELLTPPVNDAQRKQLRPASPSLQGGAQDSHGL